MSERKVVIVDGCRTPFGKRGGSLKTFSAAELGGLAVKGLVEKTGILERGHVDSLFAGMAILDSKSSDPARYAAQYAGLPFDTTAEFVEMQCGSAITCLNHAAWKILVGAADVIIVCGMESHSTFPAMFATDHTPYRSIYPVGLHMHLSPVKERDTTMIMNSDKMAEHWGIGREECDEYAECSQARLQEAYRKGITGPEIIPVTVPAYGKKGETIVNKDEHPRPGITYEALSKMSPVYAGGVTTAGNASGVNDGAAALLVMSAEKAEELGYEPYAKWITGAHSGIREDWMGVAASYSNMKALRQAGLRIADIDVWECNEAFAAQNLAVIKDMQKTMGETIDRSKWNPNGGAIAIGHPNGASGSRISWFAAKQLEYTGGKYGCISSCCGGGQGSTAIIENLRR